MLNQILSFIDTDNTKKIQNFAKSANVDILVGFLSGKQHVSTLHKKGNSKNADYAKPSQEWENAELAKMLTFGAGKIPARPFLEDGINSKKDDIQNAIQEQLDNIQNGDEANWDKIGTMAVGAVQEFTRGDFYKTNIPNSPETISKKGSDTPLIDGADLINSVEYVIEQN